MGRLTGKPTTQPITNAPLGGVQPSASNLIAPQTSSGRLINAQAKPDLSTSGGLRQTAANAGLDAQISRVPSQGENPNQIYSGGFISDIFDTLNALQYGVTGVAKGKSFAEGVKTRQSFSDKDSVGQYGIPGTILGIALDIAVDPLTYINPLSAVTKVSKAVGLADPAMAVGRFIKQSKAGQFVGRNLIYGFGQDPIYRQMAERNIRTMGVQNQKIVRMFDDVKNISSADQKLIAAARKAGNLDSLPPELLQRAKPIFSRLDELSREAIENLNLTPEMKAAYEANIGTYMKRLYTKFENPNLQKLAQIGNKKPMRIEGSLFKKRSDIPEEIRQAWGEIEEFGYPTAKSMLQLTSAVENAKFFKETAMRFGADVDVGGLVKLADTPRLGALSGKFVPTPIADSINEIIRTPGSVEKLLRPAVATFKYAKVILNPATHARNIVSNLVLNNFEGLSPARLDIYAEAGRQIATKGKWYKEAAEQGLGLNTYAAQEIKALLTGPDAGALGKIKNKLGGAADKIADLYQKEEEFGKMAQYIFQRQKGLTPEAAWQVAERATFNYAQVTPFIRRLRESIFGFPFITFTAKATPQVARTLATKPTKISNLAKIKDGIENAGDQEEREAERASEPDWMKDGFFIKLPMKDKYGRSPYLDLTYILPFGDLISGNYFERGVSRETGLKEGVPEAAVQKAAFVNMTKELVENEDFYGNKIYKESDGINKQLSDTMLYFTKSFAPPLVADQLPGGYRKDGTRRPGMTSRVSGLPATGEELGFGETQTRTAQQELLRAIGLKINPIDLETQQSMQETMQKKAYETILQEAGKTREFSRTYIPKEETANYNLIQPQQ